MYLLDTVRMFCWNSFTFLACSFFLEQTMMTIATGFPRRFAWAECWWHLPLIPPILWRAAPWGWNSSGQSGFCFRAGQVQQTHFFPSHPFLVLSLSFIWIWFLFLLKRCNCFSVMLLVFLFCRGWFIILTVLFFFCLFFLLIECLYGMLLSFHLFIFPDFLYILYIC